MIVGLLFRQFGSMVTIGSVPRCLLGVIGAPASAMKCAQSKYGPGSQCIPAWYAAGRARHLVVADHVRAIEPEP